MDFSVQHLQHVQNTVFAASPPNHTRCSTTIKSFSGVQYYALWAAQPIKSPIKQNAGMHFFCGSNLFEEQAAALSGAPISALY